MIKWIMPEQKDTKNIQDYTIGKLSKLTEVKIETIRYYEKIKIMPAPPRSSGGQRIYSFTHMKRLRFIRRARHLGFSLEDVRSLLGLQDEGVGCAEVNQITLQHLESVRAKISDLKQFEKTLAQISSQCDLKPSDDCPILDMLYAD